MGLVSANSQGAPKLLFAGFCRGDFEFSPHSHEDAWELIYLTEGSMRVEVGDQGFPMGPGTFVVHSPGTVHGEVSDGPRGFYHLLVKPTGPLSWPPRGVDDEGGSIGNVIALIVREWYEGEVYRGPFLRHAMVLLDLLMKRSHREGRGRPVDVVARAQSLFRRKLDQPVLMDNIAAELAVSRSTLYACFREVLQRTPVEVLDEMRLKNATFLLRHSQVPIANVALGSGFCSASHLGCKLRKAYRMTAGEIREASRRARAYASPPAAG